MAGVTELRSARTLGGRAPIIGCVVLGLALVGALVLLVTREDAAPTSRGSASPAPSSSSRSAPTVADIYAKVGPSVAVVRTAQGALGTGVIAAADGTILTADHVVADGSAITVIFADGTRSRAKVAAADAKLDIATLTPAKLPAPLVPATLGGVVRVGGAVVAIGNPLGLTYSVSSGVVSGLNRNANTDQGRLTGLIQFDASVNPGSSGGPLLDPQGNVVGIVVAIADPGDDDSFAGIGFAVPIGSALGGGSNKKRDPQK